MYSVLIKKNGSARLDHTTNNGESHMYFDSLSQLVNYCYDRNIDVEIGNVHHECD